MIGRGDGYVGFTFAWIANIMVMTPFIHRVIPIERNDRQLWFILFSLRVCLAVCYSVDLADHREETISILKKWTARVILITYIFPGTIIEDLQTFNSHLQNDKKSSW